MKELMLTLTAREKVGELSSKSKILTQIITGKSVVIKTTTRQTYFLPVAGLVEPEKLKPGDLVGVNKDSYLILDALPSEYDSRVKAMEVDTRPTEQYSDIGGLDRSFTTSST